MRAVRSFLLTAMASAGFIFLLVYPQGVLTQGCPSITALYPYTPKGMWPQGSTVNVNIDPSFDQTQKTAFVAAINS